MKKLVCCGLSALLSATMFGCSSSSGGSDGDKVELTFWGHQNEPWAASYQKIARELGTNYYGEGIKRYYKKIMPV